ncbi:hypothetical protein [Proteiniclasticum sp.]|uniref:hypothetical protein n=1 Tax=Proteiniclasticum sp. TaxID=2053595 RepID=UPI00289C6C85|nr:hypothetical protein [Proteiniclasticum sp.]
MKKKIKKWIFRKLGIVLPSEVIGSDVIDQISPPYSLSDYEAAKKRGLDLDDWNDYVKFYRLGEQEEYE